MAPACELFAEVQNTFIMETCAALRDTAKKYLAVRLPLKSTMQMFFSLRHEWIYPWCLCMVSAAPISVVKWDFAVCVIWTRSDVGLPETTHQWSACKRTGEGPGGAAGPPLVHASTFCVHFGLAFTHPCLPHIFSAEIKTAWITTRTLPEVRLMRLCFESADRLWEA